MEYPTYLYHKTEAPQIVRNEDEKKALGSGWRDTPFPKEDEAKPETGAAEKALAALEADKRKLEGEVAKLKSEVADAEAAKSNARVSARVFGDAVIGDVRSGYTPPFTAYEATVGDVHRPRPDVLPVEYDGPISPDNVSVTREMPPITGTANPARLPADGPRDEPLPSIATQVDRAHGLPTPSAVQDEMVAGGPKGEEHPVVVVPDPKPAKKGKPDA